MQQTVLEVIAELQDELGFACLFVSHDLAVVQHFAERVVVMRAGRVEEQGTTATTLVHPETDYTRRLIAAVPVPDPVLQRRRAQRQAALAARRRGARRDAARATRARCSPVSTSAARPPRSCSARTDFTVVDRRGGPHSRGRGRPGDGRRRARRAPPAPRPRAVGCSGSGSARRVSSTLGPGAILVASDSFTRLGRVRGDGDDRDGARRAGVPRQRRQRVPARAR